jgi:hypothetical protein
LLEDVAEVFGVGVALDGADRGPEFLGCRGAVVLAQQHCGMLECIEGTVDGGSHVGSGHARFSSFRSSFIARRLNIGVEN